MRFGHLALALSRASALLLLSTAAFAAPVTWTLNNVRSVSGVTVTGSFVYDIDTNTYSNINLSASNGKTFHTMERSPAKTNNNNRFIFFPYESPVVSGTSLGVDLAVSDTIGKTNRGGTVVLSTAAQNGGFFICLDSICSSTSSTQDSQWASGSLVGTSPYPFVNDVSSASGPLRGGNTLTLTGVNLTGATDVLFGAVSAGANNFTVNSDTSITVTVPAQADGKVNVKVVTPNGTTPTSVINTITGELGYVQYRYFDPTATNVRIITGGSTPSSITSATGTDVGVEVKGIYTYAASGVQEVKSPTMPSSSYRWALSSVSTGAGPGNANGANATGSTLGGMTSGRGVVNLNAISYTPVSADAGKYLYYCVTPVAAVAVVGPEACSAAIPVGSIAGMCGSANGVASATAPAANLCSAGSAGAVSITGNNWGWSCSGFNNPTSGSCTAPFAATNSGSATGAIQASTVGVGTAWRIDTANSGFVAPPAAPPAGVTLPNGATKVVLDTGTPGTSTTVTLRFSNIPAGAQLYKYGKETGINDTPHWFAYPATIDRNAGTVTYTLTDGQKGDNDWTVNGVIDDPVGLGVGAGGGVEGVPTLSEWAMALMAALMALGSFVAFRRRAL